MKNRIQLNETEVADHTKCELGQWLANEAKVIFKGNSVINDLELMHKLLHEKIGEIIVYKNNGESAGLQQHLSAFHDFSHKVLDKLTEVEKSLVE
jgi:alpha-ketoglutarate-dependent taurine dioxygenase